MKESSCKEQRAILLMLKLLEINISNFTDAYAADGGGGLEDGGGGARKGEKGEEEEASRSRVQGLVLSKSAIDQIESCMMTACQVVQGLCLCHATQSLFHNMTCILPLLCPAVQSLYQSRMTCILLLLAVPRRIKSVLYDMYPPPSCVPPYKVCTLSCLNVCVHT